MLSYVQRILKSLNAVNIFLLLTISLLLIIIFFKFSNNILTYDISNNISELEIIKSQIELKELIFDADFYAIKFGVNTFGVLLGLIAVIITISRGLDTIIQNSEDKKLSKISSLLESLGAESENQRLASVRGLSQYIDYVIDEFLISISIEKSNIVKESLEKSLYNVNSVNRKKIILTNSDTIRYRSYLYGQLFESGLKPEEIAARLRLSPESINFIKETFKLDYQYGRKIQGFHLKRKKIIEDNPLEKSSGNDNLLSLLKAGKMVSQKTEITGRIIAYWISKGIEFEWPIQGLDLSETNLYKVSFKHIDAKNSIFSDCILRHSSFDESKFSNTNFEFANLYDASFNKVNFSKSIFTNCNLRSSSSAHSNFSDSSIANAIFSEGNFSNSEFYRVQGKKVKFKGTKLKNSKFDNSDLTESEFHNADLSKSSFNNAKLKNSKLISTKFNEASLNDAILERSDIRGAEFKNSSLEKVNFRSSILKNANFSNSSLKDSLFNGTELENANFTNTNLQKTDFRGVKSLKGANFSNADLRDANFFKVDLQDANFRGANIENTNFIGATIKNASFEQCINIEKAIFDE